MKLCMHEELKALYMFWGILVRGGSRAGQKKVTMDPFLKKNTSSDRKATETNRMHSIAMIYQQVGRIVVIFGSIPKISMFVSEIML